MATKYDVFEYMYEKGIPLKPEEITRALRNSHYQVVYKILLELKKTGLVNKNDYGFQVIRSKKHDMLYRLIKYSISNQINYNEILDENLTSFIAEALQKKKKFTINDFNLNPRTFKKYIEILSKYGLLIILSKKPLKAIIPFNSFLGDITLYFGFKVPFLNKKMDIKYIDEIEKEIKIFRRLIKKNNRKYQEIIGDFKIRFIHHSLSLEGNTITLPDTIKLLKDHIIPKELSANDVLEVQNYQIATEEMIKESSENISLTKETILNYHYLAMQNRPDIAGKIRKISVHIKNNPDFKVSEVNEIEKKLDLLLKRYNEFIKQKNSLGNILEFSAYFHNEFQHIHPFPDGNSRTTRLIAFHLLRTQNIPIFDIPLGLLEEYVFSTKGAKMRKDAELKQVLERIILFNLKAINAKLS